MQARKFEVELLRLHFSQGRFPREARCVSVSRIPSRLGRGLNLYKTILYSFSGYNIDKMLYFMEIEMNISREIFLSSCRVSKIHNFKEHNNVFFFKAQNKED